MGNPLQEPIRQIVDRYAAPLVNSGGPPSASQAPGGIVGVYLGKDAYYFPYGKINAAGDAPTEHTIFGLGSVTKTFTTAILGQTPALFGESIQGHAPAGIDLPWPEQPTFEQLATFTAGILPSSPPGVTTQEEFVQFINAVPYPKDGLPAPSDYSDSSIGLLGQTLMNMAGYASYDAPWAFRWFTENLLLPLGMGSTLPPPVHSPRLATPYRFEDQDGGRYVETKYWGWCPWGTAGRMFSTAADMVRFIMAAVGVDTIGGVPVPRKVLDGIAQSLQPWAVLKPATLCSGLRDSRQAFAWVVWTPDPVHGSVIRSKAGGVEGVSSYVAVNPELRYGVVVLLNQFHVKDQCPTLGIMKELLPLAASLA